MRSAVDGIGLPVPIFFCPFHGPPAPIQPVRGPGKHQQEAVPTLGGASLNPAWAEILCRHHFY